MRGSPSPRKVFEMMPIHARDNERRLRVSVKESAEAAEVVIGVWRTAIVVEVRYV